MFHLQSKFTVIDASPSECLYNLGYMQTFYDVFSCFYTTLGVFQADWLKELIYYDGWHCRTSWM